MLGIELFEKCEAKHKVKIKFLLAQAMAKVPKHKVKIKFIY
jgi:hypothetical protein